MLQGSIWKSEIWNLTLKEMFTRLDDFFLHLSVLTTVVKGALEVEKQQNKAAEEKAEERTSIA